MYIYRNVFTKSFYSPRRCSTCASFTALHVEYAERRLKYGILFTFSPFYEYSNLEYEDVPV